MTNSTTQSLNERKLSLVKKIIELDNSYECILMRNSGWGYEYEYLKLYELKELLTSLKIEGKN